MNKSYNSNKEFLDDIVNNSVSTTTFLNNGVKLQGDIVGHDKDAIFLKRDGVVQLVYKMQIATVLPCEKKSDNIGNVDNSMWTKKTRGGRDDVWNK